MLIAAYIVLGLVALVSLIMGFIIFSTAFALLRAKGVPYVPLNKKQLAAVNQHVKIPADLKVVDLGCGDGRVLRMFEKQGVKDLSGYEINLWAHVLGRIKNWRHKSQVKLYLTDFNKIDLGQFDIVFCYLLESYLKGLRDKFDRELKPGTKIVSYGFEIPDWRKPDQVIHTDVKRFTVGNIFIYLI